MLRNHAVGTTTISQVVSDEAKGAFEVIMVNGFSDEELEAHVKSEAREPMDIGRCVFASLRRLGTVLLSAKWRGGWPTWCSRFRP